MFSDDRELVLSAAITEMTLKWAASARNEVNATKDPHSFKSSRLRNDEQRPIFEYLGYFRPNCSSRETSNARNALLAPAV